MIALINQMNLEEILEHYKNRCESTYETEEDAERAYENILSLIEEGATEFEVADYFDQHK